MGNSTSQLALGILLRFTDQGSGAATKAIDGVQKALDSVTRGGAKTSGSAAKVEQSMRGMGGAAEVAGRGLEKIGKTGAAKAALDIANGAGAASQALDKMSNSRAADGAAHLAKEAHGATAALDKMRQAADRAAGAGGSSASVTSRMKGGLQGYLSAIAGYTAGKAVLAGPVGETMNYERQLANVALTAAPKGASLPELQAIHQKLNAGVMAAIRPSEGGGGGSRETALAGLNALIGSGKYKDVDAALSDLKWVQKGATAYAAEPVDVANMILAGQSVGVGAKRTLEIAGASGKDGSFETKNMAKHIPTWLPYVQGYGMKGEQALIEVVTMAQAAMRSAGSQDEAGTNVKNALQKLLSNDTVEDAKKIGIDLRAAIAKAVEKGISPLDAFGNLLEQQMVKNPNYQKTLKQLQTANGPERQKALEAMAAIYKGAGFSSLVQDMQATGGWDDFLAQRHAKENSTSDLRGNAKNSGGLIDENLAFIKTLSSFNAEVLAAEKANAMQTALDKVNPLLGGMADWLSKMAQDYPAMAAATWGATAALTALSAAAGAASLANLLTGGAGAGGVAGQVLSGASRLLAPATGAAAFGVGYGAGSLIYDHAIAGTSGGDRLGEFLVSIAGFFGNQEAKNALLINRQNDAAQAMKDAADELKRVRPAVYVDPQHLDREMQQYQSFEARRR